MPWSILYYDFEAWTIVVQNDILFIIYDVARQYFWSPKNIARLLIFFLGFNRSSHSNIQFVRTWSAVSSTRYNWLEVIVEAAIASHLSFRWWWCIVGILAESRTEDYKTGAFFDNSWARLDNRLSMMHYSCSQVKSHDNRPQYFGSKRDVAFATKQRLETRFPACV